MNLSPQTTDQWLTATRLTSQQISTHQFREPEDLIAWFGGIQGQDYISSKWAIGLRIPGVTDISVERAFADARIVRTWAMRGTLHVVSAADIRWLTDLLAPRIIASAAFRHRQLELDEETFRKCFTVLEKTLRNGKQLTREELATALEKAGISTEGQRLSHILQRVSLEKIICFGPKRGNSVTFTLLDEWVPAAESISREEALAELAKRYFSAHGPATLKDFTWWSGLKLSDARKGIEVNKNVFDRRKIGDDEHWFRDIPAGKKAKPDEVFLLPAFDEYVIGYRDRDVFFHPENTKRVISSNGIFYPVIVAYGQVIGTWKRTTKKDTVMIELSPFRAMGKESMEAIGESAGLYSKFTGKKVEIM